jgi:hypothetical protein
VLERQAACVGVGVGVGVGVDGCGKLAPVASCPGPGLTRPGGCGRSRTASALPRSAGPGTPQVSSNSPPVPSRSALPYPPSHLPSPLSVPPQRPPYPALACVQVPIHPIPHHTGRPEVATRMAAAAARLSSAAPAQVPQARRRLRVPTCRGLHPNSAAPRSILDTACLPLIRFVPNKIAANAMRTCGRAGLP